MIDIGTRGFPALIIEGDLPGGDKAGREAGWGRKVSGRPARPTELAVETATNQGVSENGGTRSATALDVGASESTGALLVLESAPLDGIRRPCRTARCRLALLDLEVFLPLRVCKGFRPISLSQLSCIRGFYNSIVEHRVGI